MGRQANELISKFGGDYTYEQLRVKNRNFNLDKIKYEYPGSVKGNNFTELEDLSQNNRDKDAKKAIKLLLQLDRLNSK